MRKSRGEITNVKLREGGGASRESERQSFLIFKSTDSSGIFE